MLAQASPPGASDTVLKNVILVYTLVFAMATNGTSPPAANNSGTASEAPTLRRGLSLDNLLLTQMQGLL